MADAILTILISEASLSVLLPVLPISLVLLSILPSEGAKSVLPILTEHIECMCSVVATSIGIVVNFRYFRRPCNVGFLHWGRLEGRHISFLCRLLELPVGALTLVSALTLLR